jgi:Flp pilus assembly protein TadG
MTRNRLGRWRSDRGAELVEFALVTPVLLLLGLGMTDFGLMFQRYEVVTNAAREGARAAATGASNQQVAGIVGAYLTGGGLTTAATVTIDPVTIGNPPLNAVRVSVAYPNGGFFIAPIATFFGSSVQAITLRSTATMRLEIQAS